MRAKITRQCGEFFEPTGHLRPAALEKTAEGCVTGQISRDHVRNIIDVMNHLPTDVPAETRMKVEDILVGHSRVGWPDDRPKIGRTSSARRGVGPAVQTLLRSWASPTNAGSCRCAKADLPRSAVEVC
ncbi:hypothetical protein ACFXPS_32625 [Nocardia sp. NPDC059091]|uniref:hypothetical protein n=1 Tax=unclassified Nocardia TaxID=2637762 RepID=UPI003680CBC6